MSTGMGNLLTTFLRFMTSGASHPEKILSSDYLNHEDSGTLEALCQFFWIQGDPLPLIFDVENEIYTKKGITLITLKRLEANGLIDFDAQGFVKKGLGKHTRLFYCGKPTKIGFRKEANNYLDLGHVLLTERGKKLASAFKVTRNQEFYEYVIGKWFQQGLVLSSIQIQFDRDRKTGIVEDVCSIKE